MSTRPHALIDRIETYLDAAPRSRTEVEDVGPFTLFRSRLGQPYFARTSLGWAPGYATAVDVRAVCARQRDLGLPERIEWLSEIAPYLGTACVDAGLRVTRHPLLVHHEAVAVPVPDGITVRRIDHADDAAVPAAQVVARLAFASPDTAVADIGSIDRQRALDTWTPDSSDELRRRIAAGESVVVVAEDEQGVICSGGHNPIDDVTEIVGLGTLPAYRRQGLGAAVTDTLVADAIRRGVEVIFLSADNDAVARVYERVGFQRIGTACTATGN
jgi:ribosomal protein S18 acetylase RimI-like enzyme